MTICRLSEICIPEMKDNFTNSVLKKLIELETGYEFPAVKYELTSELISSYDKAVEAHSPVANVVSPMAIAAFTLTAMSKSFSSSGSIHAGQDLQFLYPVTVGSTIDCQGRIIKKTRHAQLTMMEIEVNTFNQDNVKVVSGKMTIIVAD